MSDITPEERRKVAEKLRQYVNGFDFGDANPVWYVMKSVFGDVHKREYSELFTRLADLIDPTCHMSWEYDNGDDDTDEYMELIVDTPEDTVACHCHACDIVFRFERNIVPDYCPFCGARVVRDEA